MVFSRWSIWLFNFAILMFGLCQSVDLYWKIKGFFKNRSKNRSQKWNSK